MRNIIVLPDYEEIHGNELHIFTANERDFTRILRHAVGVTIIRTTKDKIVLQPVTEWASVTMLNWMRVKNKYAVWVDVYVYDGKEWVRIRNLIGNRLLTKEEADKYIHRVDAE